MRVADHIIHITESFHAQTDAWGIPRDKITVIPNWGALDEIDMLERPTDWGWEQGCPFRLIRPSIPTTSAHSNRAIRPPVVCRVEA
jgi:hypothetical protein